MNDYWTAYSSRLERNEAELLKLAKEVEADSEVEVYIHDSYPKRRLTSVTFFKGEEINHVDFVEVPYRWKGCGFHSHRGIGDNVGMPFTAKDVLESFDHVSHSLKRNPKMYFQTKKEYLKWYSFLNQYTIKDDSI
jgi:hypothetical protein